MVMEPSPWRTIDSAMTSSPTMSIRLSSRLVETLTLASVVVPEAAAGAGAAAAGVAGAGASAAGAAETTGAAGASGALAAAGAVSVALPVVQSCSRLISSGRRWSTMGAMPAFIASSRRVISTFIRSIDSRITSTFTPTS